MVSHKFSISFHLAVSRPRGWIIFSCEVHHLCVAPVHLFTECTSVRITLPFGLGFLLNFGILKRHVYGLAFPNCFGQRSTLKCFGCRVHCRKRDYIWNLGIATRRTSACRCFSICYPIGFLSYGSYTFYSCKFSIPFHLVAKMVRTRGEIIFCVQFHSLCVACVYLVTDRLPLGLAFQRSRFLPHYYLSYHYASGQISTTYLSLIPAVVISPAITSSPF